MNIEESYSENTASRKINVEATDNAIDKIAVAVASLTSPFGNTQRKFPNMPITTQSRTSFNNLPSPNPLNKTIETQQISLEGATDTANNTSLLYNSGELEEILPELAQGYFKQDSDGSIIPLDSLRIIDYGSQEKTRKDKIKCLILLYILTYEFYKQDLPSKDEIYELVRKEKLYDSNFINSFNKKYSKEYLISSDQIKWSLDFNGRKQISKIIDQIYNPSGAGESVKRKTRAGRPKGSVSKASSDRINDWMLREVDPTKINTGRLKLAIEWALFGYHLLLVDLNVDQTLPSGDVYSYLSKKFKTINVKKNIFQDSISKNKAYFNRTTEGNYHLSPEGIVKAKSFVEIDT